MRCQKRMGPPLDKQRGKIKKQSPKLKNQLSGTAFIWVRISRRMRAVIPQIT